MALERLDRRGKPPLHKWSGLGIRLGRWSPARLMLDWPNSMRLTLRARSPVLPAVRSTCRKRACTICVYRPRMAKSNFASRPSAARPVSGIFFPQRIPLRIDGGSVSPAVLEKKVLAVAYAPSYSIGELLLRKIGGIELTSRGLNKTAVKIGLEMVAQRDAQSRRTSINRCRGNTLSRRRRSRWRASASMAGGCKLRDEGGGKGVHHPHWRENKNALFLRMKAAASPTIRSPTCPPVSPIGSG